MLNLTHAINSIAVVSLVKYMYGTDDYNIKLYDLYEFNKDKVLELPYYDNKYEIPKEDNKFNFDKFSISKYLAFPTIIKRSSNDQYIELNNKIDQLIEQVNESNKLLIECRNVIKTTQTDCNNNTSLLNKLVNVKSTNISSTELLKQNSSTIYLITDNIKIMVGFLYKKRNYDEDNEYKYYYDLNYYSLDEFDNGFDKLNNVRTDGNYKLVNYYTFGIVNSKIINLINLQKFNKKFVNIYNEPICDDSKLFIVEIVDYIEKVISKYKNKLLNELIANNDDFDEDDLINKNNKISSKINKIIEKHIDNKINGEEFKFTELIDELTNLMQH